MREAPKMFFSYFPYLVIMDMENGDQVFRRGYFQLQDSREGGGGLITPHKPPNNAYGFEIYSEILYKIFILHLNPTKLDS